MRLGGWPKNSVFLTVSKGEITHAFCTGLSNFETLNNRHLLVVVGVPALGHEVTRSRTHSLTLLP